MKRVLLMVLLALTLPLAAFASSSVDFTNGSGTLTGSSAGMTLSGSTLIAVSGLNGMGLVTGDLGVFVFSTGALTSGSLQGDATFAPGGYFVIGGNGTNGIPNGVIFQGTFSSPVTWTMATLANGTHVYTLQGAVVGKLDGGHAVGYTVQITVNTGRHLFDGSVHISMGDPTNFNIVAPEPGTLGLLGTGLVGLACALRRKLKA